MTVPRRPFEETKTGRAVAWLKEHPSSTAAEARAAGHNPAIVYWARRKIAGVPYRKGTGRKRGPYRKQSRALAKAPPRSHHSSGDEPLLRAFEQLRSHLGIEELHLVHDDLEIVQRRRLRLARVR